MTTIQSIFTATPSSCRNFAGKNTAGVVKDVVIVPRRKIVEAEFVANNPGTTLFHCHQQLHMDFGFMALIHYA